MTNPKLIQDEDFREDCRQAGREDVHPALRKHRPTPKTHCRACGQECDELTEDELCPGCNHTVECLEAGNIEQPVGELRPAARCSQCKLICWQDELMGGVCPECFRQHVGEIKGDDVG